LPIVRLVRSAAAGERGGRDENCQQSHAFTLPRL
jgi:hypothetical protein